MLKELFKKIENEEFFIRDVLTLLGGDNVVATSNFVRGEIVKNLEFLIVNCQESYKSDVRNLARELALKVDEKQLAKNLVFLINCQKSNDSDVRNLASKLALKVMVNWEKEQLVKYLEFLVINCQELGNSDVRNLARELALKVDEKQLAKNLVFLINCQKSRDSNVRNLARELALKVDGQKIDKEKEIIDFINSFSS